MKKLLLVILIAILFTSCSSDANKAEAGDQDITSDKEKQAENESNTQGKSEGFPFEYNGVDIYMNDDAGPVVEALGEPQDTFEAESCAFKGLDKIFYYNGIELSTYPNGEKDFISSVNITDDSVSTIEGITIGSTLNDLTKAYGSDYTEESGLYTYLKDKTKLTFLVENEEVTAITYLAVVDGLQ